MHAILTLVRKQLGLAWRHRWVAVLFTWAVCAAGWAGVLSMKNIYEAGARIYVDSNVVLDPALRNLALDSTANAQLDLLQRTLLSRPNLDKLISRTPLELDIRTQTDRDALIERLGGEIRVNNQGHNLFAISYRNASPQVSYEVVRTVLTMFVESKTGTNRQDMENASKFLDDQIGQYERQLQVAERRRAEFRAKYIDVLPGADGGASRLEGQQGAVRNLQGQLEDALERRANLTRELAGTPAQIVTEVDGPGENPRLREAERQLEEMRMKFTDRNPDVIAQKNLIATLRSAPPAKAPPSSGAADVRPGQRSRMASNPVYERLKLNLVENDSTIASLNRQIAEATRERDRLEAIARGAPQLQADFDNINRDYGVLRRNYDDLLARREAMRLRNAADVEGDKGKVQIIDPPQVPRIPVAPKRVLLMTGVLLGGLAAGVGLAVLLAQIDQSFHSVDDLRELGFPVVGGVSLLAVAVPFARRLLGLGLFATAVALPFVFYGGLLYRVTRMGLA